MKRSDFKIGFSKLTYMILHTTKQRTPVPTGVLCLKPYLIAVSLLLLICSIIFLNYMPRNSLTTFGISSTSQVAL